MSTLSNLFYYFCRLLFKFYCPLTVEGQTHLPQGSYVLCSNHCSHMDTPALMIATQLQFRKIGLIAAKDYFFEGKSKMSVFKYFINLIPINRKITRDSINTDIKNCKTFIENNHGTLIFYPEGTRSLTGEMQPFKRGIGLLALELGVPIVPAHIDGTYRALKKGRTLPRPSKIKIKIGEPIFFTPSNEKDALTKISQQLEFVIKQLQGDTV